MKKVATRTDRWRIEPEYAVRVDQSLGVLGVLPILPDAIDALDAVLGNLHGHRRASPAPAL